MTPFLYLRSVTVYRDLVPRQVMDTFSSFGALIRVVVERCLRS